MSVNLTKGEKFDLKKSTGGSFKKLIVGLGWDVNKKAQNRGFLARFFGKNEHFDCDVSAILCVDGKIRSNSDVVYFGNLKHPSEAVEHLGDNLTGFGEGDDERIMIMLDKLPSKYDKIVFVVNIYNCESRKQHFGMIENAFIRVVEADTSEEICRYNLSDNYSGKTSLIAGEVYKSNGSWKFNAIGQGTEDKSLNDLENRYM